MFTLTSRQRAALLECLRAIESGSDVEACLARYPEDADALRPLLLLGTELAEHAQSFAVDLSTQDAGRRALLDALATSQPTPARLLPFGALVHWSRAAWGRLRGLSMGWQPIASPVVRFAAVALLFLALGGGALGASAAGGFEPARDVLAALRLADEPSSDSADVSAPDRGSARDGAGRHASRETDPAQAPTPAAVVVPTTGDPCESTPCGATSATSPVPSDEDQGGDVPLPPNEAGQSGDANGDGADDVGQKPNTPPAVDAFCQAHPRLCRAIADFCSAQPDRCESINQFCRIHPDRCRSIISFCQAQPERCREIVEWCRSHPDQCRQLVEFCRNQPLRCREVVQFCQTHPDICRTIAQFCQTHPDTCRAMVQWCANHLDLCLRLIEFCRDHPQQCLQAIQYCVTNVDRCLQAPVDQPVVDSFADQVAGASESPPPDGAVSRPPLR